MTTLIALSIRSYSLVQQQHAHSYCQLVLPIQGQIDITIANDQQVIGTKRCAIIKHNEIHSFSAREDAKFLVADLAELPQNLAQLNQHFVDISDAFYALVLYIEKQLEQSDYQHVVEQVNALFCQLLATQKYATTLDPRIAKTITYMEQQFAQDIQLPQLAKIACLSLSQFKLIFSQQLTMSPNQYLTKLRMEKARALLSYTDLPVNLIAERVGYSNPSAFTRRFNQFYGQPPSQLLRR